MFEMAFKKGIFLYANYKRKNNVVMNKIAEAMNEIIENCEATITNFSELETTKLCDDMKEFFYNFIRNKYQRGRKREKLQIKSKKVQVVIHPQQKKK